MPKQKKKYYVVWKGRKPGIYISWEECHKQIRGFDGAIYKAFPDKEIAEKAYETNSAEYIGKDYFKRELSQQELLLIGEPNKESISVDAACSGNPGIMEYRGVLTANGKQIFRKGPYQEGTVNIGEFLALVHGLAYLKKRNSNIPVYSDSLTAIKWVKTRQVKTKLEKSEENEELFDLIDRAIKWLENNSYGNQILKWHTEAWGEIPADFGRK